MRMLATLSPEIKQYLVVTGNYWAFTLTDGALRMLVVLHFNSLGYNPLEIALLFLFYEFFGVITNLFGGWLGAKVGLNKTMNVGLTLQIAALTLLLVPPEFLSVMLVMFAQALSGVAKDLNKMSAKSAIKLLVPENTSGKLYKWVAILTGSKNTLKGAGFFLGAALLSLFGFRGAILIMVFALCLVLLSSLFLLRKDMGKSKNKPKFTQIFSKSEAINLLSAARLFLFGARDVWFVVALPVYLSSTMQWDHWYVGAFLAIWIIGYGVTQTIAPSITGNNRGIPQDGNAAFKWAVSLTLVPALIAISFNLEQYSIYMLLAGLVVFSILFAVNSSLHSYLILNYAREDGVSLDVGFYYMANAMGRLLGTVLSGFLYQQSGIVACLWVSTLFIGIAALISKYLPKHQIA